MSVDRKELRKKFRKLYRFDNILLWSEYKYWNERFEKWLMNFKSDKE